MNLSNAKLVTMMNDPMSYYLHYKMGINLKAKKPALEMGSAIHWGIEHNTDDLTNYYNENGTFFNKDNYTDDQRISEVIVKNYLDHKDEIFDELLTDTKTGEKLTLLEEYHELTLTGDLTSYTEVEPHHFLGIIDLLLLTNKGFIIVDYKTSSRAPDFDQYIDQIYRYCFLLHSNFPDTPILKIAVVNLRKLGLRRKVNETSDAFTNRLIDEYKKQSGSLIFTHIYEPAKLDQTLLTYYIKNLSHMADTVAMIDENDAYFINYANATNQYGKSDYYDILYHNPDAYLLYNITDEIYDEDDGMLTIRDCRPIDMLVIDDDNVLNKYEQFKVNTLSLYSITRNVDKKELFDYLKKNFICDDELLEIYWKTLNYQISHNLFEM